MSQISIRARSIALLGLVVVGIVPGGFACAGEDRTEPELRDEAGLVAEWKYLGSLDSETVSSLDLDHETPSAELTDGDIPVRVYWVESPCKDVPKMTVTKSDDTITFDVAIGPDTSPDCISMAEHHFFEMQMTDDAVGSTLMRKPLVTDAQ